MYTFVADKLDVAYLSAIPENHQLQECDVPEEEMELREIVEVWYESAFLPAFNLQNIDIENKAKLTVVQMHVFSNDTSTPAFLLKTECIALHLTECSVFGHWNPLQKPY